MTVTLSPAYEHLRDWVEKLPGTFDNQGHIIYDARNRIRVIEGPDGALYNVKRYCRPIWLNRLVYTLFRAPKAVRAYENAIRLLHADIATPRPVAYILCGEGLLEESYLITEQMAYPHRLYEWGDGLTAGREQAMRAFGQFTARMHEKEILHLDYSPGNILFDAGGDDCRFAVVDINRMYFGPVSIERGCREMGRLWGEEEVYRLIAEGYARERNADTEYCFEQMWQAHQSFWSKRKKPKEYQSKV